MKIGNLKVELRDEMVKEDNIKDVGTQSPTPITWA